MCVKKLVCLGVTNGPSGAWPSPGCLKLRPSKAWPSSSSLAQTIQTIPRDKLKIRATYKLK